MSAEANSVDMLPSLPGQVAIVHRLPFIGVHLAGLLVFAVGVTPIAVVLCIAFYLIRMFGITAGYHRYFSHRSYKTSRIFQFLLAFLGCSSAQQGPLWWAAHHRHHHKHSDTEDDIHSPIVKGLFWAHLGWLMYDKYIPTDLTKVKDLTKYKELLLLERWHYLVPVLMCVALYFLGEYLSVNAPYFETNGIQLVVWGFIVSTILLYHGTFAINSLAHLIGTRRYGTEDQSKNSFILSLITLGEGWHNNHHRFPSCERQGVYWWELDVTHYILKLLEKFGLVWDLVLHPKSAFETDSPK